MGQATQVYPDTRDESKVKGPVARFMVTRSYDNEYKCIACTGDSKRSIFDKENITGDESIPNTLLFMADGSCVWLLRYGGMTLEVFNFFWHPYPPRESYGHRWVIIESQQDTILRILGEYLLVSHTVEPVRSGGRSHTIW